MAGSCHFDIRHSIFCGSAVRNWFSRLLASLGFCCCGLVIIVSLPAGLFAWIAGSMERRRCREQGRQPHGLLVAGWILGIIATALSAAWLAFMLIYMLAVGTMFSLESLKAR